MNFIILAFRWVDVYTKKQMILELLFSITPLYFVYIVIMAIINKLEEIQ
jgi:hypothetical protein